MNFALLNRIAFSHEAEVRLIFISDNIDPVTRYIRAKIEPNELFDEVTFDPRLETFELSEREAVIKRLGYEGKIVESKLYESPNLFIFMNEK